MLTLFHAPRSRSSRIIWLLEELGAPFQLRHVTIRYMDGSGDGPITLSQVIRNSDYRNQSHKSNEAYVIC